MYTFLKSNIKVFQLWIIRVNVRLIILFTNLFMNNCCIIISHFITRAYNVACVHIKEQIMVSVLKERVQFNTFCVLLFVTCVPVVPKLF